MSEWVLILGCSTGHGGATAKRLAKDGYGIIGFHLDRGEVKKEAELLKEEISKINLKKMNVSKFSYHLKKQAGIKVKRLANLDLVETHY